MSVCLQIRFYSLCKIRVKIWTYFFLTSIGTELRSLHIQANASALPFSAQGREFLAGLVTYAYIHTAYGFLFAFVFRPEPVCLSYTSLRFYSHFLSFLCWWPWRGRPDVHIPQFQGDGVMCGAMTYPAQVLSAAHLLAVTDAVFTCLG